MPTGPGESAVHDRRHTLPTYRRGERVTLEEVKEVLADDGYSADIRKTWLKQLLTDVTAAHSLLPTCDKSRLIAEIKAIIDEFQDGKPMADDVL